MLHYGVRVTYRTGRPTTVEVSQANSAGHYSDDNVPSSLEGVTRVVMLRFREDKILFVDDLCDSCDEVALQRQRSAGVIQRAFRRFRFRGDPFLAMPPLLGPSFLQSA